MSVWPVTSQTRTPFGIGVIGNSKRQSTRPSAWHRLRRPREDIFRHRDRSQSIRSSAWPVSPDVAALPPARLAYVSCGRCDDMEIDQVRSRGFAMLLCSRHAPPGKDPARRNPMLARGFGDLRASHQCLGNDPCCFFRRPVPPNAYDKQSGRKGRCAEKRFRCPPPRGQDAAWLRALARGSIRVRCQQPPDTRRNWMKVGGKVKCAEHSRESKRSGAGTHGRKTAKLKCARST
jgi:hypothetical protein